MSAGLYEPGTGWLYRCDPRAKLGSACLYLAAAALARGWAGVGLVGVAAGLLWWGTGRSLRRAARLLRPFLPLLVFIFAVNILGVALGVSGEASLDAVLLAALGSASLTLLKLLAALVGAATVMLTTSPALLTTAVRQLLRPLGRLGLKVDEAAFSLSAVLRFAPLLREEALRVRTAQISRGATFEGGLVQRVQRWVPVITPLFVGALRRSDRLAYAVVGRAFFAPGPHTSLVELRASAWDGVLIAAASALVVAVMLLASVS